MINLKPSSSPSSTLQLIQRISGDLTSAQKGNNAKEALYSYLSWAYSSLRVLGPHLRQEDIDRLVTTKRFWALQSVAEPSDESMIRLFINLEIEERSRDFEFEIEEMRRAISDWKYQGQPQLVAIVLDTNILLEHHHELATLDWTTRAKTMSDVGFSLLVPLVVLDELDRLKRDSKAGRKGMPPIRTQARQALKTLEKLLNKPGDRIRLRDAGFDENSITSEIYLSVMEDPLGHLPLTHVDSEIADRALTLLPFAKKVCIATYDTGLAFRARYVNLDVCKFEYPDEEAI